MFVWIPVQSEDFLYRICHFSENGHFESEKSLQIAKESGEICSGVNVASKYMFRPFK